MVDDIQRESQVTKTNKKRNKLFFILFLFITIALLSGGAYYYIIGSKYVTTDNAYVGAEIAQITPSISGIVKEIKYNDTDSVKAGDVLVVIEDIDFQLNLASAEADLAKAQVDFERAKTDYTRRLALQKSGSVSEDEVTSTRNTFKAAQALLQRARVAVERAKVDLDRTIISSPINGVVAKRQVQLGQRVEAGTPLMAVVPIDQVHVDANFKEGQMKKIKIGQPVELISDLYGNDVVFHGKVVGIAGGTGSAFAIIPAQNATGNWVKVIQRLPVRIKLNPQELRSHPLQVGLSMQATVDVSGER